MAILDAAKTPKLRSRPVDAQKDPECPANAEQSCPIEYAIERLCENMQSYIHLSPHTDSSAGGDPRVQVVADHRCPGLLGGGLHMNDGVDGLCISARYILAIFDSWSVVRAVLGVAGVKPFHNRACSYLCTAHERRILQHR
jgi:hypothetical protein